MKLEPATISPAAAACDHGSGRLPPNVRLALPRKQRSRPREAGEWWAATSDPKGRNMRQRLLTVARTGAPPPARTARGASPVGAGVISDRIHPGRSASRSHRLVAS